MAVKRANGMADALSKSPVLLSQILHLKLGATPSVGSSDDNKLKLIDTPRPKSTLNTGPAREAVTAISPKPFFVIATLAFMSPRQLPTAKRVSPSSDLGILKMRPIIQRRSTTKLDVNAIQLIDMANPSNAIANMILGGATVFLVQKHRYIEQIRPGAAKIDPIIKHNLFIEPSSEVSHCCVNMKAVGIVRGNTDALNLSQSSYSAIGIEKSRKKFKGTSTTFQHLSSLDS